jgi:hypothetical protein
MFPSAIPLVTFFLGPSIDIPCSRSNVPHHRETKKHLSASDKQMSKKVLDLLPIAANV